MRLEERDSAGWALKALREAGGTLLSEFAGLDETTLRQRPADGELSLKEIAAHLRDAEELALLQLTGALEEPEKKLPHWDIDVLPFERDYRDMDVRYFLSEWRGLRGETTSLLWTLRDWEWRKPLITPTGTKSPSRRSPASWPSTTSNTSGRCGASSSTCWKRPATATTTSSRRESRAGRRCARRGGRSPTRQ